MKDGGGLVMVDIVIDTSKFSLNVLDSKRGIPVVILRRDGVYWVERGYLSGGER